MNSSTTAPAQAIDAFEHDGEALKAQAERCRRLAAATYNREVAQSLGALAADYERSAEELSRSREA